jgi:eukaryotic-like serine/threonine-protein kinase
MAFLGEFLYYQSKTADAEPFLARSVQLGASSGDDVPLWLLLSFTLRGEPRKIQPTLFKFHPPDVVDGDEAYWAGRMYALLGDRTQAILWLKRAVELGNVNYPWFQRDKNWENCATTPSTSR